MRPLLVDLFCGAGGAAVGYYRAGFDILGVDHRPQPRFPFDFVQADALEWLASADLSGVAAIHASPPCQAYSVSRTRPHVSRRKDHPRLIAPTRKLLRQWGGPYVIENVQGARTELEASALYCGGAFQLGVTCADGTYRALRRHRLFESNLFLMSPGCGCGSHEKIGVYGNGGGWANRFDPDRAGYKGNKAESATAMGIGWMTIGELSEAIPPDFTQHVGEQLLATLATRIST